MTDLAAFSRASADLAAAAAAPVVGILGKRRAASGFVWRDGLVVAAEEDVEEGEDCLVLAADGRTTPAQLIGTDAATDIALFRAETSGAAPAVFATEPRRVGEWALCVGRGGAGPIAAQGLVAASGPAWRSLRGGLIDAELRLDLRLSPVAEGGLAVDARGLPLGMAVYGPRRSVLVIPGATIDRVAARLAEGRPTRRGYLGLGLAPVRLDDGGRGAMIAEMDPNGPGRKAGLLQGDILVAVDGAPLGLRDLQRRLGEGAVGASLDLAILRAGAPHKVAIVVGERP